MNKVVKGAIAGIAGIIGIVFVSDGLQYSDTKSNQTFNTPSGQISGVTTDTDGIINFKGIPFAKPPVNELRWKPAVQHDGWNGVLQATSFAPRCMQSTTFSPEGFAARMIQGLGVGYLKTMLAMYIMENTEPDPISEDCLYLNVRTPAAGNVEAKLPVMVWIHGGGHQGGAGSDDLYQSDSLVKEGVVLVTINYRLGVFGYLAHPALTAESAHGASGNYGLLDQMAALRWVRDNIDAYGGDKHNVTIFGESAGAWGVSELMASPLSQGLFHKAIGESGASSTFDFLNKAPVTGRTGEGVGAKVATELGLHGAQATVEELRAIPAQILMDHIQANPDHTKIFHPIVEGWSMPKPARIIFADGEQAKVPLLIGGNADEGSLFYSYYQAPNTWGGKAPREQNAFATWMQKNYGDYAQQLTELYGMTDEAGREVGETAMLGDDLFLTHIRSNATYHARLTPQTYLYHFTRTPPDERQTIGAFHATEMFFLFDKFNAAIYKEDADEKLQQHVIKYWTNFAKNGDPNGEGLVEWPIYSRAEDKWLILDHEIKYLPVSRAQRLNILELRVDQAAMSARAEMLLGD